MITAQQLIDKYSLQRHPEGGWFAETYRSEEAIPASGLPARFGGSRLFSTAIYFLLQQNDFSAFHKIKSDECWHFYAGDPLDIFEITEEAEMKITQFGTDPDKGQLFQYVVPANRWFASRPAAGSNFSFVGCTVAPGFDYADFEIADRDELIKSYPQHTAIITALSR